MEKFEENDCLFFKLIRLFEIVGKDNQIENKNSIYIYLFLFLYLYLYLFII